VEPNCNEYVIPSQKGKNMDKSLDYEQLFGIKLIAVVNAISPGTILFLPFTLFSFWVAFYLWKIRDTFFK